MDLGLKDRAAIVTAASRGLGKAAAQALATAEEIQQETGVDVLAVQTDLTEPKQIEAMVAKAHKHFQKIDILIINAGGPPPGGFLDLKPEDWTAAVNLTVMSAVRLCYAVVPHMLKQGHGSIVATQSYADR